MYGSYPRYVPVAERRAKAKKSMAKLQKKGTDIQPVEIDGRTITKTFWGKSWCKHLENFSDYSNRLPRGRTYVRNGSVCHLDIKEALVTAMVSGSSLYNIKVNITPLSKAKWKTIQKRCAGEIGSMLELLQGKISANVMSTVTNDTEGLFPLSKEIKLHCDCPDSAYMCKHIAAVLYGIGARLDHSPELLFMLRGVNHEDLISKELTIPTGKSRNRRVRGDLTDIFNVDLDDNINAPKKNSRKETTGRPKRRQQTPVAITKNKKPKSITAAGIKRLKKSLGLNNTQFAKLLKVSPPTIKNWENKTGKLNLRDHNRERIELILDMDQNKVLMLLNN